jgi:hypothetical protein
MASIAHWRRYVNTSLLGDPVVSQVFRLEKIEECCRQSNYRWRDSFWSPALTLLTFILQIAGAEKTLRAGVAALLSQLKLRGEEDLPSADPTAYCQARKRLPSQVLDQVSTELAHQNSILVGPGHRWRSLAVKIVDGSSVSMPDTPLLQKEFPQPGRQKPGCGFPVARLVALFCWATGAVIGTAIGNLRGTENNLLRQKFAEWFKPGDLLLGDRHFCAYTDIARLLAQGVHCLFRLHQRRPVDFRKASRLGRYDQEATWTRPEQWLPSSGMTREEFEQLPETLTVRMIRVSRTPKGFRSRTVTLVTTLLDPIAYPANEIRALYRDRWTAELNLRSLKTHLSMEILRGQSPDVVRKEITMHIMVYNLIRLLMWHAARQHGADLHRLSFTGTLHRLRELIACLIFRPFQGQIDLNRLLSQLLQWIADDRLPHRPNRFEPRRKKRRPKVYSLLSKTRRWYHLHGDQHAR